MKKTGVFLGFQPGSNLSTEGIGRLLAFILKENDEKKTNIILFCPKWLTNSVQILLKDNKIPEDRFEIVSTSNIPLGVKVKNYLIERRIKKARFDQKNQLIKKLKKTTLESLRKLAIDFFSANSLLIVLFKILGYMSLFVCLLPFLLMAGAGYFFVKFINLLVRILIKQLPYNSILNKIKPLLTNGRGAIYQVVLDNELNRVVDLINKRTDIDVCFIPSMIWSQIRRLNCRKILAAPDIVFYDFPTQFPGVGRVHERIRESIAVADHLICYSEHVKKHHLIDKCGVDPNKITVIKHANIDMNEHLKISKSIQKFFTIKQNAKQIVNEYIYSNFSSSHVLYNVDFEDLDFVIYSSQYRSHKNVFNLIKAIKIINNDMHGNIKLILTGDYRREEAIKEYVHSNNLENDIFVMHNISSELLAALNKLAKCSVNPTLFEGGFPFTFSESYSVGTPSVMSNIPVVSSEIDDPNLKDLMLFDPYNPYSIAEKIVWAIDNAQTLFDAQDKLYQKFSQRDWKKVVSEYNEVFNKAAR
ncbi:glycosyltransferase [Paenibacillus sediminis]|uniref:Glycosyltransferase involved in cell wall biosynthesis n=1 Tax=Paenibacillus sediminis TaxID=664909 RepID=A0ABS4H238_9BACL|nr:glycosyltransferase [Paenibacillus sediminis]MBP1936599.1 glycosyltransferase involved in cell wall biosynthesis [Paenibacillus sediminis]